MPGPVKDGRLIIDPLEDEVVSLSRVRLTLRWLMASVLAFAIGLAIAPARDPALALLTPTTAAFAVFVPFALVVPAALVLILAALAEIILGFPVPLWIYVPIGVVLAGALWPRRSAETSAQSPRRTGCRRCHDRRTVPHPLDDP